MRNFQYLVIPFLTLMTACLIPAAANAKAVNLMADPSDSAKVVGTIDLANGIVPIFTPKDGLWMKVGDPRNGNTGWIKNSDLKDSQGTVVSVSQNISEDKNGGKTQSVDMSYGKPMTPEQKQMMQQQLLQQQQNAAQSMVVIQKNLDEMKKLYNQQFQIMQKIGFPAVPGMGTTPEQPAAAPNQAVPRNTNTPQ